MKVYFHYSLLQRFKIPMNFSLQVRRNFLLQRFKIPLNFSLQVRRNFLLQRFKIPLNFSLQVKRNILTMSFYLNDLIFVASLYYMDLERKGWRFLCATLGTNCSFSLMTTYYCKLPENLQTLFLL